VQDVRLRVVVEGRVQGVGFRYWTRARARELALRGSATNLADGRVEVIAEGPRGKCQQLLDELGGGDAPGAVVHLGASWEAPAPEPDGFRLR
jgi:acylphosphatase